MLQPEAGRPWTHGTTVEFGDHLDRSSKMQVTDTDHIITRTKRHAKTTPGMTEGYHWNVVSKKSVSQVTDKLDELTAHYMKLYEHEEPEHPETVDANIVMSTAHPEPLSRPSP